MKQIIKSQISHLKWKRRSTLLNISAIPKIDYSAEEIIDMLFKTGISAPYNSTNPFNAVSEIKITKKQF